VITPTHYMLLSAALFIIGVIGVMVRRNIIIIFMSIELILNAVNINLVAFSNQLQNLTGQVFAIFVIAVAAAEAAVGLGIILAFYRNKVKVFETPVVERTQVDSPDRHAAIFQFEVPADSFKPGLYTCQINIIDEVSGHFAFPRLEVYVH